jgi:hypothetical protein
VVNDGITGDEEQPALNLCWLAELFEFALKFHEHVVEDVFGRRWVSHPRANELSKSGGKPVPDLLNIRLHRINRLRQCLTRTLSTGAFDLRSCLAITSVLIIALRIIH